MTDPELAKLVLSPKVTIQQTNRNIGKSIPIWGRLFGDSLFMVSGDVWKRQHRIAARSFGSASTAGFLPTVATLAERFVANLVPPGLASATDEPVVLRPATTFGPLALEIICSIAFGLNDEADVLARIGELTHVVFDGIQSQGPRMMIPGYLRLPTATNRAMLRAIDELHAICGSLVHRYRDHGNKRSNTTPCLLAVLCDAADGEDKLSVTEVVHNVFAFMAAGMDTTSTTLAHLVCCLASHPTVQDRLFAELGQFATHADMLKESTYGVDPSCTLALPETCPAGKRP